MGRITWMKCEIKSLHAKKQKLYELLYRIHLEILNDKLVSKNKHNKEKFKYEVTIKTSNKQKKLDTGNKLQALISEKQEFRTK